MTNKEAIKMLKSKLDGTVDTSYEWCECVRMAIKALEQEPCEDCISKKEAVNALRKSLYNYEDKTEKQFLDNNDLDVSEWFVHRIFVQNMNDADVKAINDLPPVQQEPKTEWIPVSEKMPVEREWVGTKRFGTTVSDKVHVTFEAPNGKRFTKQLMFHNGKLSKAKQDEIDAFCKGAVPVAWMPLPEPYEESERRHEDNR